MPPELVAPELADPARFHIELENDRVRVLRLALHGDEDVPLLGRRAGLLVCLDECHVRVTRQDGRSEDVHLQAGQTRWVGDDARSLNNLSPQPTRVLYIEMKAIRSLE